MKYTTFIFVGIISAVIGTAYAAGENTVTSKSYVDAQDALKQNKITSKTLGNVVTYNGTDANGQTQFDERGIFDMEAHTELQTTNGITYAVPAQGHEGDLITARDFVEHVADFAAFIGGMKGPAGTLVMRDNEGWLNASRAIYNDTVANYNSSTQSNDIPTMGAVMSAITAGVPTGTAGNVVTYNASGVAGDSLAVYNGSAEYSEQNNADDLITAGAVMDVLPIYDGSTEYDEQDNANDLVTAGAMNGIYSDINNTVNDINNTIDGINNTIDSINDNINTVNIDTNNSITNVANMLTSQPLDTVEVQKFECANNECTLYEITPYIVHKLDVCDTANDCPSCGSGLSAVCGSDNICRCVYGYCATVNDCPECGTGSKKACTNNVCACNACKPDGVAASNASECCGNQVINGVCNNDAR